MVRKIENIKISRVLTNSEEINHFIDTEGVRYGLKPVPPDWNSLPKEPPLVIVEPWKREPTLEELLRAFEDNQLLKPLIPLPVLVDCVKQRNALIAFYNEANGKQWNKQDNWCNKSVNLEDWYGVRAKTKVVFCASGRRPIKFQTVTHLELSHNSIRRGRLQNNGYISARIGDLVDLEVLNLSFNFICGRIPDNLWKLTKLEFLGLHFNQLEGKISPKIGNLTKLRRVQLDHNHLTGIIPETIGRLKNLEGLFLHMNNLDSGWRRFVLRLTNQGKPIKKFPARYQITIPASIGELTKLKEFYVYQNQLSGKIPAAVKKNPNFDNWIINPQQDGVKLI